MLLLQTGRTRAPSPVKPLVACVPSQCGMVSWSPGLLSISSPSPPCLLPINLLPFRWQYIKYNTVLRSKTADAHMLRLAKELTKGNGYATSIHAINSCVIKLSKLTKAGKIWRGIKDATLPKAFWVPNEMGVRGGIEYGFSSTTTDRDQALLFAGGGSDQQEASTIFEMRMGMVDRGADLAFLSQYPHEQEVLLPPLTGIEALGTDVEGSMMIISSRLSLNLAAHTLEQVLSRRRKMLLDMAEGIELEMRDALGEDLVRLGITQK